MKHKNEKRRGAVLVLVAVLSTVLIGFAALAVDVGRLTVATAQCQNAADAAAIAGREPSTAAATPTSPPRPQTPQLSPRAGKSSDKSSPVRSFRAERRSTITITPPRRFTRSSRPWRTDNYGLTQVTITHQVTGTFCGIFGVPFTTVTVTATAAHRPRDVAIVLDYSGSMNNESDLWNVESYLGNMVNTPEQHRPGLPAIRALQSDLLPQRHAAMHEHRSARRDVQHRPSRCWVSRRWPPTSTRTTPAPAQLGLHSRRERVQCPRRRRQLSHGQRQLRAHLERCRQSQHVVLSRLCNFQGYTQGPGYWGKTFFIWPPQPTSDWRKLYFELTSGSPLNDNTQLWNSSGIWQNPSGNYIINYKAILNWIKNIGPNPFPPQLRGRQHPLLQHHPQRRARSGIRPDPTQWQHQQLGRRHHRPAFLEGVHRLPWGSGMDPTGNVQIGTPTCSIGPDFTAGSGGHPDHRPRLRV